MTGNDYFLLPQAWPILLAAPLSWFLLNALQSRRERRTGEFLGPRAAFLSAEARPEVRRRSHALFAAGLLLAGLAVMQPAGGLATEITEPGAVDLVICLDVSRSMLARDVPPTRLARAQAEIRTLAARAQGDRMGLVAFAGEARLLVPLTENLALYSELVSLAEPGSAGLGGTDLGAALDAALEAFTASSGRPRVVLLLTDGEDLERSGAQAAERCAAQGVTVHCLALGSAQGSKIVVPGAQGEEFLRDRSGAEVVSAADPAGLRAIASATGGSFSDAANAAQPLTRLYEEHILGLARPAADPSGAPERPSLFAIPLLAAFLLWILEIALTGRARA